MISPDTAAGILIGALLSAAANVGLIPSGFLMYRCRGGGQASEHKKLTSKGGGDM